MSVLRISRPNFMKNRESARMMGYNKIFIIFKAE